MKAALNVYNQQGLGAVELEADIKSLLWRLGETGTASFSISPDDAKATRDVLCPANRVLVEFHNGLPDWGGVIDFPLKMSTQDRSITVNCYEGDHMLGWRVSGKNAIFTSNPVGTIVETLLDMANQARSTGVQVGGIYSGGASQSRELHYDTLLSAIRDLRDASGFEYAVVPVKSGSRLDFYLHWYESRGLDLSSKYSWEEGSNVGEVILDEQGPVYNSVFVPGKGDWADKNVGMAQDNTRSDRYGLRELPSIRADIEDEDTLDAIAEALLALRKNPSVRATLADVTNQDPALYSQYGVGDVLGLVAFSDWGSDWAYDGEPFKLLSRRVEATDTCVLEVERVWD